MNIEFGKQIHTDKFNGVRTLLVTATDYENTKIYGQTQRPVEDCPVELLDTISECDWSNPLLKTMQREAMEIMRERTNHAAALAEYLDGILATTDAPALFEDAQAS